MNEQEPYTILAVSLYYNQLDRFDQSGGGGERVEHRQENWIGVTLCTTGRFQYIIYIG